MPRIDEKILVKGKYPDRDFFAIPKDEIKPKPVDRSIFKQKSVSENIGNELQEVRSIGGIGEKTSQEDIVVNKLSNPMSDGGELFPGVKSSMDMINKLHGVPRKIFFLIASICIKNETLSTGPLNMEFLTTTTETTINTIRSSVRRLVLRKLIKKEDWCPGRGGYTSFNINEGAKTAVIEMQRLKTTTSRMFFDPNPITYNNGLLAEHYIKDNYMPKEWLNIDCSTLDNIGFGQAHLLQIYREFIKNSDKQLPASIIQDSINALAFDLKYNKAASNFKNSPAVVLTALLKKGVPYVSTTPEKLKTPQQEAMEAYLAAKEQQKLAALETEEKIKQLEFTEWQSNLSEEELLELCPENEISEGVPEKLRKTMRRKKALELSKDYFDAEIWPVKKHEILA